MNQMVEPCNEQSVNDFINKIKEEYKDQIVCVDDVEADGFDLTKPHCCVGGALIKYMYINEAIEPELPFDNYCKPEDIRFPGSTEIATVLTYLNPNLSDKAQRFAFRIISRNEIKGFSEAFNVIKEALMYKGEDSNVTA